MTPAHLPWHDHDLLLTQAAIALGTDRNGILRVHAVPHRPLDFVQVNLHGLLLQRADEFRPTPYDRLVLLDREIHAAQEVQPTPFNRFSKWMPYITNRKDLLAILGLQEICQTQPDWCHVWRNNIVVDMTSDSPIHISDGDFLKIYVGDMEEPATCLSDIELPSSAEPMTPSDEVSGFFQHSAEQLRPHLRPHQRPKVARTAPQHEVQPRPIGEGAQANQLPPPRFPVRRFAPGDRWRLERLFEREALLECEEEGRIAYLDTWYIQHDQRPICRQG